jgi:cytochrome c-type biogenesis protein CcmH/NrfG
MNPGDAKTLDSLAFAYLRLGQYRQAMDNYDAALKISPNLAESLFGRGTAKFKSGDSTGGATDLKAATAIDPAIATKMAALGVTH